MSNGFNFLEEHLGKQRKQTLNNDEAAMATAVAWSLRSKDPSTQVGACIINEEGRLLSAGYNGTPNQWADEIFPWGKDAEEENTKYPYVIHAEMNAISNFHGLKSDLRNSTMYVTLFPCTNCAKLIIQMGITKVVYLTDDRKESLDNICAKRLLDSCGIEYIDFETLVKQEELDENNKQALVRRLYKKEQ